MRKITATGLTVVGLSAVLVAGCSRESSQQQRVRTQSESGTSTAPASGEAAKDRGQALVRVVNAVPDQPALDVIADEKPVATNVDYKTVTPYKEVSASADDFAIKPATQQSAEPIAENSEAILGGRHYTLVAFPEPSADGRDRRDMDAKNETNKKVSLDVIADDLEPPPPGMARVRVINAAAGTDDVAVYMKGKDSVLFSDVDFKEAVAYKDVDPMKTTLVLRVDTTALLTDVNPKTGERTHEPGTPRERADRTDADRTDRADTRPADVMPSGRLLGTQAVNFEAGKSYTIVLAGRADGRAGRIETLVVEDMLPQTTEPTN